MSEDLDPREMCDNLIIMLEEANVLLSASQYREADLREKMAAAEENLRTAYPLSDTLQAWKQRAEAAEARIKVSQEQEPVGYFAGSRLGHQFLSKSAAIARGNHLGFNPVFATQVIQPDLAELQRENAELKKKLEQVPSFSCGCISSVDW